MVQLKALEYSGRKNRVCTTNTMDVFSHFKSTYFVFECSHTTRDPPGKSQELNIFPHNYLERRARTVVGTVGQNVDYMDEGRGLCIQCVCFLRFELLPTVNTARPRRETNFHRPLVSRLHTSSDDFIIIVQI